MSSNEPQLSGSWLPTQLQALHYGSGTIDKRLLSCLPSPESKAFIVTGSSLASKTSLIEQVERILGDRHVGTFAKIGQHAPVAQLDEATVLVLKEDAVDTVISIGGGSPIDSAKVISYRVKEKKGRYLYHITIPTTISAAECTGTGGYTNEKGLKVSVAAKELVPQAIIYDSTFALETPPTLWLSTGMRAMDHATELLYHPDASELNRMMVLQAAAKLYHYLPRYLADPKDEEVITQLQLAAFASLAYKGFEVKGALGLSHTLGYALGSPYGIPHGITSCITLGHVVRLKAQDPVAAKQVARMVPFLGLKSSGDDRRDAEAVGDAILQFVESLGLKTKLSDKGVGEDQIPIITSRATGGLDSGPTFEKVSGIVRSML